jgi:hypothetical protein
LKPLLRLLLLVLLLDLLLALERSELHTHAGFCERDQLGGEANHFHGK